MGASSSADDVKNSKSIKIKNSVPLSARPYYQTKKPKRNGDQSDYESIELSLEVDNLIENT